MKKLMFLISFIILFPLFLFAVNKDGYIYPGEFWLDNNGNHINAHGGCLLYKDGIYYWYGEHKGENSNNALVGVNCYSSSNLVDWTFCGVALSVSDDENSDIVKGCIIERPKVVYNRKTKKYVMWFHLEMKGKGYDAARAGVAISDTPQGPFKYISSSRVNKGKVPCNLTEKDKAVFDTININSFKKWWTPEWITAIEKGLFVKRDLQNGQMSRDMTIFVDDNGKAYHIYSSEDNLTLQIAELSDDYLSHTGKYVRMAPGGHNEAPAIFKRNGMYWMITSGCTGWAPNKARMFSSKSIWGPWKQYDNPCKGVDADLTFHSQSTYIQQVQGLRDAFIFMGDRWMPKTPSKGTYIWLPIQFDKDDIPYIEWKNSWNPNSIENYNVSRNLQ